jgi:hypothetical protein
VHGRKLANINLSDETTAPQDRLPFDILLSTADSMTITSILRVGELDIILSACGDSHQLAKLGPDGANDKNYLNSLASFMDSQRQVAWLSACGLRTRLMQFLGCRRTSFVRR